MGGYGSGRDAYASTPTVEECRHLDVDRLKEFTESTGFHGTVWWGEKDDPDASITVISEGDVGLEDVVRPDRLRLKYTIVDPLTDEREQYDYAVPVEYTECNFGGYRPWFRCPGVVNDVRCGRRVGKLYRPGRADLYLCRHCYDLGYTSSRTSGNELKQAELRYRRAFAKADAENRRPHPNSFEPPYFPERPKGMHWGTFDRLLEDVREAREEWTEAEVRYLQEVKRRLA